MVRQLIPILLFLLLVFNCVKVDPLPFVDIESINDDQWKTIEATAELGGSDDFTVQEMGFLYSSENPVPTINGVNVLKETSKDTTAFESINRTFSIRISNLAVPPHRYYVRAYLKYRDQYVYSPGIEVVDFDDGWVLSDQVLEKVSWSQVAEMVNGRLYFGLGCGQSSPCQPTVDFWSLDPFSGPIEPEASFPAQARSDGVSFVLDDIIYFGLGTQSSDFWKFDFHSGEWEEVEDLFPGEYRSEASSFVIDDRAYVGFGQNHRTIFNDLYAFDGSHWTQVNLSTDSVPPARRNSLGFSHQGLGYLLMGSNETSNIRDLIEIIPMGESFATWRRVDGAALPNFRHSFSHLKIRGRTFLGLGLLNDSFLSDWYEFSPNVSGYFMEKASLPSRGRAFAGSSNLDDAGYVIGGLTDLRENAIAEIWKYIPDE